MGIVNVMNNEQQMQFQIHIDGEIALLEYRFYRNALALMHTEVPENLEGKGLASQLARYAFEWARIKGMRVRVYCSFVKTWLEKHPEYADIIDK
jgi:predicted GNAT family acetyltransferase